VTRRWTRPKRDGFSSTLHAMGLRLPQVAAIKVLREMDKAAAAEAEPEPSAFDRLGLYDDEFSTRRRQKADSS
jgi:hypothetical protein